ncbi:MAG: Gfo/Idh/MocA family oxidoreductase [Chlorobium sp.]|jgi:predicted dehydrogenase|uniref:Gfo/Idh/MocA family protein n=1 Tax=Chlorobium sp. TaxID=1095 RepID=UPI001D65E585|nr:Gfo/Idh/MocA family oxidoreductase [Chlorobium sp.]MBN1278627.1 Gfo/Idh/MocA family oxidoreductase [Chlorobiaceae bacterium]MCF8216023.1 Gfo/Idh/MocA family oxidoreductase [Chlorobium sp.]MCF8270924.1 Gfo/Idh/MocA family oxidoreductase [Chlorobium sp.]MCF8287298.1 Gfo/Idh/MocA family oxidoreductase [Chlorobium sp.]MCF8291673.1 Gfo/Idh/MocA family oxidoreductase [Chlorobium sp.]
MRIGIIGTGKLGEFHTKLLGEIAETSSNVHVSGIYDKNIDRAAEIAHKYGVRRFGSLEELSTGCDAAVIATTTSTHFDIARQLLIEKKHLFIEKPITATLEEADELIRLEEENGVRIQVGHIERFNPALRAIESYIGEPMYIQAERLSGFSLRVTDVSVVLDLMIHDIDLVLSLIKSDIKSIAASGVRVFSNELDMATARIDFVNGATANVTASRLSRNRLRKMRFFCNAPKSYASLDLTSGKSEIFRLVHPAEATSKNPVKTYAARKILEQFGEIREAMNGMVLDYVTPDAPRTNALKDELEHFIDAVQHNRPVAVSSRDGRKAVMVADRIADEIAGNAALSD